MTISIDFLMKKQYNLLVLIIFFVKINSEKKSCDFGEIKSLLYKPKEKIFESFSLMNDKFQVAPLKIVSDEPKKTVIYIDLNDELKNEKTAPYLKKRNDQISIITSYQYENNKYEANLGPTKNYDFNVEKNLLISFAKFEIIDDEDVFPATEFKQITNDPIFFIIVYSPIISPYLLTYYISGNDSSGDPNIYFHNGHTNRTKFISVMKDFIRTEYLKMPRYTIEDTFTTDLLNISAPIGEIASKDEKSECPYINVTGICPLVETNKISYNLFDPGSYNPIALLYDENETHFNERFQFLLNDTKKIHWLFNRKSVNRTYTYNRVCKLVKYKKTRFEKSILNRRKRGKTFTIASHSKDFYYVIEKRDDYTTKNPFVRLGKVYVYFEREITDPILKEEKMVFTLLLFYKKKKQVYKYYFKLGEVDPYITVQGPNKFSRATYVASWLEYTKKSTLLPYYLIPLDDKYVIIIYKNGTYSVDTKERALLLKEPLFMAEKIKYQLKRQDCETPFSERITLPQKLEAQSSASINSVEYFFIFCTILTTILFNLNG